MEHISSLRTAQKGLIFSFSELTVTNCVDGFVVLPNNLDGFHEDLLDFDNFNGIWSINNKQARNDISIEYEIEIEIIIESSNIMWICCDRYKLWDISQMGTDGRCFRNIVPTTKQPISTSTTTFQTTTNTTTTRKTTTQTTTITTTKTTTTTTLKTTTTTKTTTSRLKGLFQINTKKFEIIKAV